MTATLISETQNDLGLCLIDVCRQPGDLYDSWDIVPMNKEGGFDRLPCASYGSGAPESATEQEAWMGPFQVIEVYSVFDRNGWTERETVIYADGKVIASRGN